MRLRSTEDAVTVINMAQDLQHWPKSTLRLRSHCILLVLLGWDAEGLNLRSGRTEASETGFRRFLSEKGDGRIGELNL